MYYFSYSLQSRIRQIILLNDTLKAASALVVIEFSLTLESALTSCGLLLRANDDLSRYYQLRFEPSRGRMVVDRWPRSWDYPFMVERPLSMEVGQTIRMKVVVDGTCLVAYADDRVGLSCRMYDDRTGALGLFAAEGAVAFQDLTVRTRR